MELSDEDRTSIARQVKEMLTAENPGFVSIATCIERHKSMAGALRSLERMLYGMYGLLGLVFVAMVAQFLRDSGGG